MLTSRQPFWLAWGPELTYLYNDAYRSIIGGKHPAALGRPMSEVWSELWKDVAPLVDAALHGNEGIYEEAQLLIMERYGYPEETYYTFSFSPIPDDDGGTGGLICANSDDTKRVIGERQTATLRDVAALTANARSMDEACALAVEALGSNTRDVLFSLVYLGSEADGRPRLVSRSAGTDTLTDPRRWSWETVLDSNRLQLVDVDDADAPTGSWRQPSKQAAVLPIAPPAGSDRPGMLVVGLNPFRQLDEEYRGFLELIAAQIAGALANANAFAQEAMRAESLAELNRAKTAFFSNVSHEFRTPLTLMLGPLEDALREADTLDPAQRERLQIAHRNSTRLLKLVNTLLDFARIEAGRVDAAFEPTDLGPFTTELASNFRAACERAGLTFSVHCPALAEPAYVDRSMWETIVFNLISNAFKFTLQGEIGIRLADTGTQFALSVHDTGTGIDEASLPRLFERFHRIEGSGGRSHEGSGIGLALVQELVRIHGGTIDVRSVKGSGSTFTIAIPKGCTHLPATQVQAPQDSPHDSTRAKQYLNEVLDWIDAAPRTPADATAPQRRARVLLADDNPDLRAYVQRLLADYYDVDLAADGEAALRAARRDPPDLLVCDVMMPRLDGFALLAALRSDPALRATPVIMLSARAGEEARLEGLSRGADDYLSKPFSARELLVRVGAMLHSAEARRATMEELRKSEQRLQVALEAGNLGAWELDVPTGSLILTERSKFDLGFPQESNPNYEQILERIHPDDRVRTDQVLRQARAGETSFEHEFRVRWQNGSVRFIVLRGRPVLDEHNEVSRIVGVTLDVTARRQAEQEERLSEARYRLLTEVSPQAVWMARADGHINYANRHWYEYSGLTPEQTYGNGWTRAVHPDYRQQVSEAWTQAAANGEQWHSEVPLQRASDGAYRWHLAHGQPLRDDDGVVIAWMGIAVDIHDSKMAEERERRAAADAVAAAEANAKFRTFFEQGSYFAGVMLLDGTLIEANRLSLEACGFTREEVIGRKFWECGWWSPSRELAAMVREGTRQAAAGQTFERETHYFVADGSERNVHLILTPVTDKAGNVLFIAPTGADITDRKQAEEKLQQLALELAESDRRKDEFLAMLSHELRNPLAPLRNCLDLMRLASDRNPDDGSLVPLHGMMKRQVDHLVRLVDDLLEISRISRGVLELRKERVEMVSVVRNAIETAGPLIRAADHQLQEDLPEEPVWLDGDAVRLAQILANLLNNAAKYTDAGGRIWVRVHCDDQHVTITVGDNGLGIAPETLPTMFEMFTRGDRASGKYQGGLGIGLALSRRLAELHGGTLNAYSDGLGKGAEFVLKLPVSDARLHVRAFEFGESG